MTKKVSSKQFAVSLNYKMYQGFKDLNVYKLAYKSANDIFQVSRNFPKDEKYSLTDQIRRSSRSVCANIAEAFRKRRTQNILSVN